MMKIYYGWHVVAISAVMLALAVGASIQSFGLYVLPASTEFHLTRAQVNTGAILLNIGMALAGPVLGGLIDRRSARLVTLASALLFGGSLVALGLSHDVRLSAAVIFVPLAVAAAGCGTLTSPTLVARWFTVHRARAISLAMLGISIGPVILIPVIGLLITSLGWRGSLIAVGLASGAVMLLLALFLRDRPGPGDVEPGSGEANPGEPVAAERPMTAGELFRRPDFWTIALSAALTYGIMQAIIVSLIPFAQGQGLSLGQGASLMSVFGVSAIAGSLLMAWLGDRFDRFWLVAVATVLVALAGASLALAMGYATILACAGAVGITVGMFSPPFLALLADQFGAASFGTANGTASFLSTGISAVCIRLGGEIFDRTGSYSLMFVSFLGVGALAMLLLLATKPLTRTS